MRLKQTESTPTHQRRRGRWVILVSVMGICLVGITAVMMLMLKPPPPPAVATFTVTPVPGRAASPTPTPPTQPQAWNSRTPLVVINPKGVWLRVHPSHLSLDEEMLELPFGTAVRVIGEAVYELGDGFGQWWWLVSANERRFGWVEESSLGVITITPTPETTLAD